MTNRLAVILPLLIGASACEPSPRLDLTEPELPPAVVRPSFLIILTDDQDVASLPSMARVRERMTSRGTTFANAFVTTSHCCPSRVSMLRGQYAHNTGVLSNSGPFGGFARAVEMGIEGSTLAVWLSQAGYHTAWIGKYLNEYQLVRDAAHVPPGWSDWYIMHGYWPVRAAVNGASVTVSGYSTDLIRDRAVAAIRTASARGDPFFVVASVFAPHSPSTPAPRHAGMFAAQSMTRGPAFDEVDLSDKPAFLRVPPLTPSQIRYMEELTRLRLETLQGVDELVEDLYAVLESEALLDRTYVMFTSDNGYLMGEHRIPARKNMPYEESIRVPLVVTGPDVSTAPRRELVLNIDLAPTIADLAGVATPEFVDGRSFAPLLRGRAAPWRSRFLIEHWPAPGQTQPPMRGVRSERFAYYQWDSGETELYDLHTDPFQLRSIAGVGAWLIEQELAAAADRLAACQGASCRMADL